MCPLPVSASETEFRQRIVTEARAWCGTPYHLNACVKGAGADCARFILGVFRELNLADETVETFSSDWFHHTSEDAYLFRVLRHAEKVTEAIAYRTLDAKPGCIVLLRCAGSRVWNHGAIVTEWPLVCHAVSPAVEEIDAARHPMWMHRQIAIFDPWLKHDRQGQ